MKFVPLAILIGSVLGAITEPHTIRSPLTGPARIDGAHANQAIAVLITPNASIYGSDEIQIDPVMKWKRFIPVNVWRYRAVAGVDHWCLMATLHVEFDGSPKAFIIPPPQLFVIPADKVKEFDGFVFEGRSWYSITTSISSPAGAGASVDALFDAIPFPGNINCN